MKSSKLSIPKLSAKKGNAADVSTRTVLAIEYNKQSLLHDVKGWNEQLLALEPGIDKIEKVSKKELDLKSQELSKEFSSIKTKSDKINHEVETAQKRFSKVQVEFETKLLEPFTKETFNIESEGVLKDNISKIQAILNESRQLLGPIVDKCLNNSERLAKLEAPVKKICLSDEFEVIAKTEAKLNERMTAICKETANLFEGSSVPGSHNPEQYDPKKIATTVLQLFDAHRKGKKLLRQIQENLHIEKPAETPVTSVKIETP